MVFVVENLEGMQGVCVNLHDFFQCQAFYIPDIEASNAFILEFADGAHTNEVIEKCTEGAKLIKYTQ